MREPSVEYFEAVVNDEEQYSIWPKRKAPPAGWRLAGKDGTKEEVMAWIQEVWRDSRPLGVRKAMDAGQSSEEAWQRK
jgi:MbtH protein